MPVPIDLSKLSNLVKIEVIKKIEYDELVKKITLFRLMMQAI